MRAGISDNILFRLLSVAAGSSSEFFLCFLLQLDNIGINRESEYSMLFRYRNRLDLLFYHRGLSCLVAFELKIDKFKPEYLGKMNFYLEVLDRDYKKPNENPSIGVILCASKEDEVVEYAMSRNISPALISEYTLKLIDKRILEQKLREYKELLPDNNEHE
jgi:hypothetical protein